MSGLDDLVAEAMKRKLIVPPPNDGLTAAPVSEGPTSETVEASAPDVPAPDGAVAQNPEAVVLPRPDDTPADAAPTHPDSIAVGRAPAISIPFAVNGVKCIVTIHVETGATVTEPSTARKRAPSGGVKVKGIRGATTAEPEAPEASEAVFDKTQPIGDDNLPEGWVNDPVVGATLAPAKWLCPEHGKAEERTSTITGRTFTVCPTCGKLAPR